MNTEMKLYEITYTDKYSKYSIDGGRTGLRVQYYMQDFTWRVEQFDNCKIMESTYSNHKLLTPTETQDLLWNGLKGGYAKR